MTEIIAEFHYWDYGAYVGTAMEVRPAIRCGELEELARAFNVSISINKASSTFFSLGVFGRNLPRYDKVIVRVVGGQSKDVRTCVGRIFLLYGRPDEVPSAFFGGKKVGKRLIDELLREFEEGKR